MATKLLDMNELVRDALGDLHYKSDGNINTTAQRFHNLQIVRYIARAIVDIEKIYSTGISLNQSLDKVTVDAETNNTLSDAYKSLIVDVVSLQRLPKTDKSKRFADGSGFSEKLPRKISTVRELVIAYKVQITKAGSAGIFDTTGATDNTDSYVMETVKQEDKAEQSA